MTKTYNLKESHKNGIGLTIYNTTNDKELGTLQVDHKDVVDNIVSELNKLENIIEELKLDKLRLEINYLNAELLVKEYEQVIQHYEKKLCMKNKKN